jgi:type II secretory pathway component GspD/PulD (secretin)
MKHAFASSLLGLAVMVGFLRAEPKRKTPPTANVVPPPAAAPNGVLPVPNSKAAENPNAPRSYEFRGEDLPEVLKTLAKQGGFPMVMSERISKLGQEVTIRVENKTPRELVRIMGMAYDLIVDELDGVTYVKTRAELTISNHSGYEAELEYRARPETAHKIAQAHRALFEALLEEKFTREEALRLVIANLTATPLRELVPVDPPQQSKK